MTVGIQTPFTKKQTVHQFILLHKHYRLKNTNKNNYMYYKRFVNVCLHTPTVVVELKQKFMIKSTYI